MYYTKGMDGKDLLIIQPVSESKELKESIKQLQDNASCELE
jgi:hypothetical protein